MKQVILLVLVLSTLCYAQSEKSQQTDIEAVKAQVKELEAVIKTQKKQIRELQCVIKAQEAEIARLKELCCKARVDPNLAKYIDKKEDTSAKSLSEITATILSKPIFGIYLGEKLSDVQKRFATTKLPLDKWAVHLTSTAVEDCHINTYKDRVWAITVWLKDNTERNFNTLKRQLKKEYGKYQIQEAKSSNYKYSKHYEFTITLDDIPVLITITFSNNALYDDLSEKDNELAIQYIHCPLMHEKK